MVGPSGPSSLGIGPPTNPVRFRELDIYLVDRTVASVPDALQTLEVEALFGQLNSLQFATGAAAQANHSYRLNTLEDLFPGRVLEPQFLQALAVGAREQYEMPLHYDLILLSQSQLKRRNYRFAILEAETAFEVYVAQLLVRARSTLGDDAKSVLEELENPRRLGLLGQRLKGLDVAAAELRRTNGGNPWVPFINGQLHTDWKQDLYRVRNRVVHAGHSSVTFNQARRGIEVAKAAIHFFESGLPELANRVQIYSGVAHLENTAGHLVF